MDKAMTRFDLEQKILDCWGITDDLKTLRSNCDQMSQDQLENFLLGLETIYHYKFEECFQLFEQYLRETKI